MTDPIRRDPCNVATTLPNADPDLEAHGSASAHSTADHVVHEGWTIAHESTEAVELGVAIGESWGAHAPRLVERGLGIVGLPLAVVSHYVEFYQGIVCAARDGGAAGMLAQAFGGDELNRPSPGRQAAFAAILAGVNGPDTGPILAQLPADQHAAFRATYAEMARRSASGDPNFRHALTEARTQFAETMREFGAGVSASFEGWSDPDRSPAFQSGERFAADWARSHPAEAVQVRRQVHANKREGFIDTARGRVDEQRYERDPSYRSGVERARTVRDRDLLGPQRMREMAAEMDRERGLPVRGSAQCRVQG